LSSRRFSRSFTLRCLRFLLIEAYLHPETFRGAKDNSRKIGLTCSVENREPGMILPRSI
jgi:hypothetical protein